MQKLLKPYWFLISVTLPQSIMIMIYYKIYNIVSSEIQGKGLNTWFICGVLLGILLLGFTIYSVVRRVKSETVHPISGLLIFLTYVPLLYFYLSNLNTIIPSSIQRWMIYDIDPAMLAMTLIMPAFIHGMLLMVVWLTPDPEKYKFNKDIIILVSVPGFWYLFANIVMPVMMRHVSVSTITSHILLILIIVCMVCFLFALTRTVFMLLQKKAGIWKKIMIPVVMVFPSIGLALNSPFGTLGDFSHWGFYAGALITGFLFIVPEPREKRLRILLFLGRCITLPYTVYFFIVFLPFLPLSFAGIMVFGLGMLMLTPMVFMFIHTKVLWSDYTYLKTWMGTKALAGIFTAAVLLLPLLIIFSCINDRTAIDNALNYVYRNDIGSSTKVNVDPSALKRVLTNVRNNKQTRDGFLIFSPNRTPYLSSLYNWIVLDNLTLGDEKIEKLERIFTGESDIKPANDTIRMEDGNNFVKVSAYEVETQYEPENNAYRSWIHFELTNELLSQAEFVTEFDMPEDCYISNYYLYVNEIKKFGLVSDKRAANWIYRQIVNVRRDPGILYYLSGDKVVFKVFPFWSGETRKTGIEFIHRYPVSINIESNSIVLGDGYQNRQGEAVENEININEEVVLVSTKAKEALPEVPREPVYYFLVDYSSASKGKTFEYLNRVKEYIEKNSVSNAEVIAVNYEEKRSSLDGNWKKDFEYFRLKGGFFPELAMKRILFQNFRQKELTFPLFILVTDDINNTILVSDFSGLSFVCPETKYFYHLDKNINLYGYSMLENRINGSGLYTEKIQPKSVLAWPDKDNPLAFLRDDGSDSVVIKKDNLNIDVDMSIGSDYNSAVLLEAMNMSLALHPEKYNAKVFDIVKGSIKSRIMTPFTSFIVLETQAQEKVLMEKQKEILSSGGAFDAGENEQVEMSEPSILIIAVLFVLLIVVKRSRRRVLS